MLKLEKRKEKKTYVDKKGNERHYYSFVLVTDDGHSIRIKPCFDNDYKILNFLATYNGGKKD